MKKYGLIATGVPILALTGVLTGCSGSPNTSQSEIEGVDPQALIREARENIDDAESCRANTKIKVEGSITAQGTTLDLRANNNYSLESSRGQEAVHTKSDSYTLLLGQENKETKEEYIYMDDYGDVIGYVSDDFSGSWAKETLTESALESRYVDTMLHSLSVIDGIIDGNVQSTVEGVEIINGKKAYKVNASITGDYLKNAMEELSGDELFNTAGVDFSDVSTSFTLYIYKDSILPAKVIADYTEAFEQIEERSLAEFGTAGTADMKEASLEMTLSDYDTVTIVVPDNVRRDAVIR